MNGQIRAHVEECDGSPGRKLTSAWWALGTHCCRCRSCSGDWSRLSYAVGTQAQLFGHLKMHATQRQRPSTSWLDRSIDGQIIAQGSS